MNKEGNTYTIIYAAVMVIVVAVLLAFTAEGLRGRQEKNAEIDKKEQILRALRIAATAKDAEEIYQKTITDSYVLSYDGNKKNGEDAFTVDQNIEKEIKKPVAERKLPVYEAMAEGAKKYVIPLRGTGLWGPVWGYIALNDDKITVFGATFGHKGETPGLGAEIDTEHFQKEFYDKQIARNGKFTSIAVVKAGQSKNDMDYVDGISGGTITSQGVNEMLKNCLSAYENFLLKK
ncbi:MAG: NADH:ubiquinone reductase (Na(+)-transporting) subunit C [Candidatus Azobacteroides sp.]|nr:NADH:ubiquinone reductase (Na(+)-transporting) subunit C [Candidatus Azobacteroides sp.]